MPSYNHSSTQYDCDTAAHGFHRGSAFINGPLGQTTMGGLLIDIGASSNSVTSLHTQYFSWYGRGEFYSRTGTSGSWDAWSRIDNFGCSTPADLASLLGVENSKATGLGGISLNTVTSEGRYFFNQNTSPVSDVPSDFPANAVGYLDVEKFTYEQGSTLTYIQTLYSIWGAKYYRTYNGSSWNTWVKE